MRRDPSCEFCSLNPGKRPNLHCKIPRLFEGLDSGILLKLTPWGLSHYVLDMFVNPVKPFPELHLLVWHGKSSYLPQTLAFLN